ncbi:MAG: filamentous hemagglutinin N-terminal domain-containing protein, partial [bacterium]
MSKRKVRKLLKKIALVLVISSLGVFPAWALPVLDDNYDHKGFAKENYIGDTVKGQGGNSVIGWSDFSIGTKENFETLTFTNMQNVLNLVTGAKMSELYGTLDASSNINVYLINPHGILIGAGSVINTGTGSFTASTRNLPKTEEEINSIFKGITNPSSDVLSSLTAPVINMGTLNAGT